MAEKFTPVDRKLRKSYEKNGVVNVVQNGERWAIQIGLGRHQKLLANEGKVLEFLSEQTANSYLARALDGL